MSGFGIGEFPIGGFSLSDSVSVADPLPGLIFDPSLDREFLLRTTVVGTGGLLTDDFGNLETDDDGNYIEIDPGSDVIVDLSTGGYTSLPTDTPYKLFPSCIQRPYNFSVELPRASSDVAPFSGGATLGIGEIRINNPDSLRDDEAIQDWQGADLDLYIGRPTESLANFTMFSHTNAAGTSYELDSWIVLQRDLRYKLQRRLQPNRYRGYGACIRGNGTTSLANMTFTCPAGALTLEVDLRPLSSANALKCIAGWQNGTSAGGRLLRFNTGANNRLEWMVINDAGVSFVASTDGIPTQQLQRVTGVLDTTASEIRLLVGGVLVATTAVTGTFSTVLTNFTLLRRPDAASNFLDADLDNIAVWSVARTDDQTAENKDKQYLGTETNLVSFHTVNDGSGASSNNLVSGAPALTLTSITWVGSLEGDSSLRGTVKPVLIGIKAQISPKLVDPQRNVYQLHDGSMNSILDTSDGGDPYTFGSDLSDIYASAPAAGSYNTCLAMGLYRLGSTAVGVLTNIAEGDNSGALGYVETTPDCVRKVSTAYGGLSDDSLNLNTFATLAAQTSARVGFYFDSEINVDVALDEIAKRGSCWWTPDRVSRISVGRLEDPSTQVSEIEITQNDLVPPNKGGTFKSSTLTARVGEVIVGFRRYNTQLSEDQVSGSVDTATRDDLGREYRMVRSIDPARTSDSDTMTIYTEFYDEADAQTEADRLRDFWKVPRRELRVTLDQGILAYFIGTVFTATINRYDLKLSKKFVAFGLGEDMGQRSTPDRIEPILIG